VARIVRRAVKAVIMIKIAVDMTSQWLFMELALVLGENFVRTIVINV
jgi:hypothetical protein